MNDVARLWIDDLVDDFMGNPPVNVLKMELDDIRGDIANQKNWILGCKENERELFKDNLQCDLDYEKWLIEQIKNKEDNNE